MTPAIPHHLARRIKPALVANAALATALLGVAASGDAGPIPDSAPAGNTAASEDRDNAQASPGGQDAEPGGTSPNSLPPPGPEPDELLAEAMPPLISGPDVRLSVSVLDLDSGVRAGYGGESFDTASIVKVDVLAALLLQAQDEGRELTATERAYAEAMIESSDNGATDVLWSSIGADAGLDAANERLGLTGTTGGPDGLWGLTQTTSEDQIALLEAVFGTESALTPASQAYIQELMGSVIPGQRWGISAASEGEFELKNGWLPRSQTGLWDINSIGRATVDGHSCLIAVVSDGHLSQAEGIAAVEAAAEAAVAAVGAQPGD
jgi:beta-lactamase class A